MDEQTLRRREFLARTASVAGLAGLSGLPGGTVIAEAAKRQARPLPTRRNMPIDHVVVVMMENRSFDHYFGWLEGADGDQTQSFVDARRVGAFGRATPRRWRPSGRAAGTRIRATAGSRGAHSCATGSWPRAAATTSSP